MHVCAVVQSLTTGGRIIVVGSSSLLGQFPLLGDPGGLLEVSFDADLLLEPDDEELAGILDEAIGEGRLFQTRFGYYADIMRKSITSVLPPDWEERLVPLRECPGVFCLEPHDLAVAKLRAGRPKDLALLTALVATGRLNAGTIRERLDLTPMPEAAIVITYRGLRQVEAACDLSGK